ncbi:MAG TPA: DUF2520 domain-containing protein, partial [Candidatus Marinimicrobia bacterium]|nr:DUF2520 domain-containing protein [Candidatus Neomarinimicrobiota bacterium]
AALSRFQDAYFAVEGKKPEWGIKLMKKLDLKAFIIRRSQKMLYHTAAVLAGNLVSAPIIAAFQSAEAAGISEDDFILRFRPLMQSVLDNLANEGTQNILSGPVKRKDINLLEQQIEALNEAELPDESKLYDFLSKYLQIKAGLL